MLVRCNSLITRMLPSAYRPTAAAAALQAFSPVVIMMALFIAGQETPTQQLMGAVFAIAAGTAVASYGEINLNPMGLACMAAAEVSEATKVVLTQVVLVGQDFHPGEWPPIRISGEPPCTLRAAASPHCSFAALHGCAGSLCLGKLVLHTQGRDTRPGVFTHSGGLTPCFLPAVEGLMYFAPACCAWLLIGVSVAEWPDMQATHAWALVASKPFHFALAAVLGFAVNSLTYAVVILASSVTLKVSGPDVLLFKSASAAA